MKKLDMICASVVTLLLTACGGSSVDDLPKTPVPTPTPSPTALVAFEPNDNVKASITWTEYGVPHITAATLESLGFGSGYAYAKDNLCILADQIIKVRSERAKYFGAHKTPSNNDNAHVISDFGYKALQVMSSAQRLYPSLSENSRALIEGYVAGYNKYLNDTGSANLAPECANQPWVKPISKHDLTAYMFSVSQQSSGGRFFDLAFQANPGTGDEYLPKLPTQAQSIPIDNVIKLAPTINMPHLDKYRLGSNAWGIGKDLSDNGKGLLLANPHFPLTGSLKFWQSHINIPGVLNVNGASLQGMPGIINIGFNNNIAWSHTVSTSRRFVVFKLALRPSNTMEYVIDTEIKAIQKKTFTIDVNVNGNLVTLSKDYFYSHHGLMIETPASMNLLTWDDQWAYTLKDAAEENIHIIDHWLAINLSNNMTQFQQAFKDYNGIPWVNSVYSDRDGNSFYIDKTRVLSFVDSAVEKIRNNPEIVATREALGFDILPGYTKEFEPRGLNPYIKAPKLLRTDFVQNANDSYAQTNPAAPLSGFSPLYGDPQSPLSLRTQMSLKMLQDSAGDDQKFSANEVESALFSNRTLLSEAIMDEVNALCLQQNSTPISLGEFTVDVSESCTILSRWDRRFNRDSVGAHLFRELAHAYVEFPVYKQRFVHRDPNIDMQANTQALKLSLALATQHIRNAGLPLDAALGDIQFLEKTAADGSATGVRYPWAGAYDLTGGFNIFEHKLDDPTLYPIHQYTPVKHALNNTKLASDLTTQGYHVSSGSSWIMIVKFLEQGVSARGLLLSSQSANSHSPHFDDQSKYYSDNTSLRPIYFETSDIENHKIAQTNISH